MIYFFLSFFNNFDKFSWNRWFHAFYRSVQKVNCVRWLKGLIYFFFSLFLSNFDKVRGISDTWVLAKSWNDWVKQSLLLFFVKFRWLINVKKTRNTRFNSCLSSKLEIRGIKFSSYYEKVEEVWENWPNCNCKYSKPSYYDEERNFTIQDQ